MFAHVSSHHLRRHATVIVVPKVCAWKDTGAQVGIPHDFDLLLTKKLHNHRVEIATATFPSYFGFNMLVHYWVRGGSLGKTKHACVGKQNMHMHANSTTALTLERRRGA